MKCVLLTVLGALAFPAHALAGWGDEAWGSLTWTATAGVPSLSTVGLAVLALLVVLAAIRATRRRNLPSPRLADSE